MGLMRLRENGLLVLVEDENGMIIKAMKLSKAASAIEVYNIQVRTR